MNIKIKLKNPKLCGHPYTKHCPLLEWSGRYFGKLDCRMGYELPEPYCLDKNSKNTFKCLRSKKCIEENGK